MTLHVLVVDDEPAIREVLREYLSARGMDAVTVSSSEAALQTIAQRVPDAIIADMHLPGLSGLGLIETLASTGHQIPVVAMTGYASVESAVNAFRSGAVDYLAKPFRLNQVYAALQRVLPSPSEVEPARLAASLATLPAAERPARSLELLALLAAAEIVWLWKRESGLWNLAGKRGPDARAFGAADVEALAHRMGDEPALVLGASHLLDEPEAYQSVVAARVGTTLLLALSQRKPTRHADEVRTAAVLLAALTEG